MLGGAVLAQLQIPPVILGVHAQLLDARLEHIVSLLALGAAAQLAHGRHQQVGRGNGLAVLVHAHVEGLDVLGPVGDEYGLAEVLLGQIALVLGLKVAAPVDRILKLLAAGLQNPDRVGVGAAHEFAVAHELQALDEAFVHEAVQEGHLLRALLQHGGDDVLHHVLLQIHVLLQRGEGDLRLDHPELGGVAGRVAGLGAEGRAEGVHVAERHGEDLGVELARHGQRHRLAKEILGEVHLAVFGQGLRVCVQRGHAEHLARALAVAARD